VARKLCASGKVAAGKESDELMAVDDPALYAASALREALLRAGITVDGEAIARHRYTYSVAPTPAGQFVLGRRTSPPLWQALEWVNKVSQNLYAELVYRSAGYRDPAGKPGPAMDNFLREIGVGEKEYQLEDGSGLSRLNLLTPQTVAKLLQFMKQGPRAEVFEQMLPIGGTDGSLKGRFQKDPAAPRIRAKTGTLSHVSGLSGFIDSGTHGPLVFSFFANNYRMPSKAIRDAMDEFCLLLAR
jgi:serine-type D-Ala-D-Ala carboxypeptidase/endopeptidase (penicillin-binding protein 4)